MQTHKRVRSDASEQQQPSKRRAPATATTSSSPTASSRRPSSGAAASASTPTAAPSRAARTTPRRAPPPLADAEPYAAPDASATTATAANSWWQYPAYNAAPSPSYGSYGYAYGSQPYMPQPPMPFGPAALSGIAIAVIWSDWIANWLEASGIQAWQGSIHRRRAKSSRRCWWRGTRQATTPVATTRCTAPMRRRRRD